MFGKRRVYLDAAAGAEGNPSSPHEEGRKSKDVLEKARTSIAQLVECQSDDVLFTSGATESNALAILGHLRARTRAGERDLHMLYMPSAHASIVENAKLLAAEGVVVEPLPVKDYHVDTDALKNMLRAGTALVSMDAVCGETGVVWNTRDVAQALKTTNALLHVDASQAPATEKITRPHFCADLLTFDASKVGPVRGIGALIAHRTLPLVPLYGGGGQERGLRSGTEAPELAARFAEALKERVRDREAFRARAIEDRAYLSERIKELVPEAYVQEGRDQAPHILNLSLPGRDTDYLAALLDEAGFAVSTRSACETDSEEGSRAVLALTGDANRARSTLRISWNSSVSSRDIRSFPKALTTAVAFVDSSSRW